MEERYLIDVQGYLENESDCTAYFPFDSSLNSADGSIIIRRFCSGTGYTTLPTDNPPNVFYEPRTSQPGTLKTMMFSEGKTMGASQIGHGEVVLANPDGGLDSMINYGFDGRDVVIRKLLATGAIVALTACSMEQPAFTTNELSLRIKDPMALLNVPIQPNKYAGTNALPAGIEGTADIKGKPKPLVFGRVANVTPVCVNTSRLIYQMHDGAMSELSHVYDMGVELVQGDEYATQASMEANEPLPGQYRVWVGGGMFRLGSSPAGQITCSGSVSMDGKPAIISKSIVLRALPSGKINDASFTALGTLTEAPVGIYINSELTVSAALDQVLGSIGAWYGFDASGILNVGRLNAPGGSPVATLTNSEIGTLERKATQDEGRGLPVWKVNLDYQKNYTVQTSGLAGRVNGTWESYTLPATSYWSSVAYGNGTLAMVGGGSVAVSSADGVNWTQHSLPAAAGWISVAYGNGVFVAVAQDSNIAATSTDGATWTQRTLPATATWLSVAYGGGLFVAVAADSTIAATSTDGITWTQRTLPTTAYWSVVGFGNGMFVALASGSTIAATSTDGVTWTQRTLPASTGWQSVVYGNGMFVAVGGLSGVAATSTDGITWTSRTLPVSAWWALVSYGNGMFIASVSNGSVVMSSLDGITWSLMSLPAGVSWWAMRYGNGMFVAANYNSNKVFIYRITPDSSRQLFLSKEYRTVSDSDATVLTKHPLATEITLTSLLVDQSDAQAEATRQLNMRKVRRDYIQVTYQQGAITTPSLGQIVQVIYPRYEYDAGKLFVVIGVQLDYATGKTTLSLWG